MQLIDASLLPSSQLLVAVAKMMIHIIVREGQGVPGPRVWWCRPGEYSGEEYVNHVLEHDAPLLTRQRVLHDLDTTSRESSELGTKVGI